MKNSLLVSGKYYDFVKRKRELYLNKMDQQESNFYLDVIADEEEFKECQKIYNANKQRKYNNWQEICKWLFGIMLLGKYKNYKIVFGTLTFSEEALQRTSKETRRRYVTRYLKEYATHYSANIDFGKKNEREHYHFLAMVKDNLKHENWKYGFCYFNEVQITNLKKRIKYLLKLNNHSYKESTKQARIIRDRNYDLLEFAVEKMYIEEFHKFKLELNALI